MILTPSQWESIQSEFTALAASDFRNGFEYPWKELDRYLEGGVSIPVAGYGSLMNRESAARTFVKDAVEQMVPVVVFHARRVYDLIMSPAARMRYPTTFPDTHCGVLNAYVTGKPEDCFNAVLLQLGAEDLKGFRAREYGYDLLPVVTMQWSAVQQQLDSPPQMAFVLSCRSPVRVGRQMIDPQLQPHPLYHEICQTGARDISDEFLKMFHQTTQIASRLMPADSLMRKGITLGLGAI